jgi:hypothetical protein
MKPCWQSLAISLETLAPFGRPKDDERLQQRTCEAGKKTVAMRDSQRHPAWEPAL